MSSLFRTRLKSQEKCNLKVLVYWYPSLFESFMQMCYTLHNMPRTGTNQNNQLQVWKRNGTERMKKMGEALLDLSFTHWISYLIQDYISTWDLDIWWSFLHIQSFHLPISPHSVLSPSHPTHRLTIYKSKWHCTK